jgi:hypothetical protein
VCLDPQAWYRIVPKNHLASIAASDVFGCEAVICDIPGRSAFKARDPQIIKGAA